MGWRMCTKAYKQQRRCCHPQVVGVRVEIITRPFVRKYINYVFGTNDRPNSSNKLKQRCKLWSSEFHVGQDKGPVRFYQEVLRTASSSLGTIVRKVGENKAAIKQKCYLTF